MKNIIDFIKESKSLDKAKLQKAIDSMLNWNEEWVDDIFKELKKSNSIYQAIDSTNTWENIYDEVDAIDSNVSLSTSIDEIKELTKKYDQQISKYICKGWKNIIDKY